MAVIALNSSIGLAPVVAIDLHIYWLQQRAGVVGTLAAAIAATDTTLTLTPLPGGALTVAVGNVIVIDSEPITVTAVSGNTLTVTRSPGVAIVPPAAAHAAGANISLLTYNTVYAMVSQLAVIPWIKQIIGQLGQQSATFTDATTGSLSSN